MSPDAPERLPAFHLQTTRGVPFTHANLMGRPHLLYLARHPGCSSCRVRVRQVLAWLPELEANGASLIIVLPTTRQVALEYQVSERLPDAVIVLADPERTLYGALGAARSRRWLKKPQLLAATVRDAMSGVRASRADVAQLGADVVVDAEGRLARLHLASSPVDRLDPRETVTMLFDLQAECAA